MALKYNKTLKYDVKGQYIVFAFSVLLEPPTQRAQSLRTSAEPVETRVDEEVCSPPAPYSAPTVQSYHAGNGYGRFNNSHGQGSRNIYKQPSILEMSNQDNSDVVLTEGKVKLYYTYKP